MRHYSTLALLALSLTAWCQSKPVAITNARIVTEPGKTIDVGAVLLKDGKIVEVGKNVKTDGADVIDGTGLFIYAGFIDTYTTGLLKVPDAPTPPTARNTSDKAWATMWHENRRGNRANLIPADILDPEPRYKDNHANGVTSAVLSSGSGMFRGSCSLVKMTKDSNVLVKQFGQDLAVRGGAGTGYPESLMGITALFRQALYDAQTYTGTPKDDAMAALKEVVDGKQPAIFGADTSRELFRALNFAKEFNMKLVLQGGREAYQVLDLVTAAKVPVIARVDLGSEPSLKPTDADDTTPQQVRDEAHATWAERAGNIAALLKAKVPVSFTSGGSPDSYLKNVRKLLTFGVSPDQALRSMTVEPANLLGVGDRIGTIKVGKDADLVVMSGDFTKEDAKVKWVFINGNKVEVNP